MAYTPQTWANDEVGGTPTSAERFNYMEAGIAAAHALVPGSPSEPSYVYNVKSYGATGNGSTDDSTAIKAAIAAAVGTKGSGTGPARVEVIFPPGRYRITQNDTLMTPSDGDNDGLTGLRIRGFGRGVTELLFNPTVTGTDPWVGNLYSSNKRSRMVHISDMTITSQNANACAFYFYHDGGGSNQNQGCIFERIHFTGNWKRVFGFDGGADANLNSEMTFRNISAATAAYGDAFFKVGGISGTFNQQNQFLDYWFYDSFFILNGGTLFDFVKGGSAHFINGSWSAANSSAPAMTFVKLRENFNNTSAANFTFSGIRFEPKATNHTVLDNQIGHGSILFESCIDVSSLQFDAGIGYPLRKHTGKSPWGSGITTTVSYRNCSLAGYDEYTGPAVTRGWITYEGCYFWRGTNGQLAVPTSDQGSNGVLRWSSGKPKYRFTANWNAPDAVST